MPEQTPTTEKQGCPRCNGTGRYDWGVPGGETSTCCTCDGTGRINEYVQLTSSSGGVSLVLSIVGHREVSDAKVDFLAREGTNALGLLLYAVLSIVASQRDGGE